MAKTQAEWKRDQRDRERASLKALGGKRISFLSYGGTLAKLEKICESQGFTGKQRLGEAITFIIETYEA